MSVRHDSSSNRAPGAHVRSLLALALLGFLLLVPLPAGPEPLLPGFAFGRHLDKLVHFVLFLVAFRPWLRSFAVFGWARPRLATVAFATTYAGLLELAQAGLTATRTAEWGDLLAGALGALAGVAGAEAIRVARRPAARGRAEV